MRKIIYLILALTLSKNINCQLTLNNWDTIDFQNLKNYLLIDTTKNDIWEVCYTNRIYFDSAFTTNKLIVTDSNGYYPNNNKSFFDLYIGKFNLKSYPWRILIDIRHKFITDTLKDGGYITVSYDKGKTWMNIINDKVYPGLGPDKLGHSNLYSNNDLLFNGEFGFSGKSNGWINTTIEWVILTIKSAKSTIGDTMILRFNFISDSIQSKKEGWMIDNIRLSEDLVGIKSTNFSKSIKIFPNPVSFYLTLQLDKEYHSVDIEICDLDGKIVDKSHFSDLDKIKLNCSKLKNGIYILKSILDLGNNCSENLFIKK